MQLITFENVSKAYYVGEARVDALKGADLSIRDGEFVAIMGPSGSGKSTLLTMLGVLNTPSSGKVTIDGIDVYKLPLERQADFRSEYIGFVFQAFQLIPYLTALENVMLPHAITKISSKEQKAKAQEVLGKVELHGKFDRLPSQLSGGEAQRVAVARALVNEPPIILTDEPTGNLDSKNAQGVMALLKAINKEGKTVIMVTHDRKTAEMADRIIELKDGRIEG
ncbi:MAG: ABC transporter ATP-binding protein [Candidatus Altiarchaeota archaeon]